MTEQETYQQGQDLIVYALGLLGGRQVTQPRRDLLEDARLYGSCFIRVDLVSAGDGTLVVHCLDPATILVRNDPAKEHTT